MKCSMYARTNVGMLRPDMRWTHVQEPHCHRGWLATFPWHGMAWHDKTLHMIVCRKGDRV